LPCVCVCVSVRVPNTDNFTTSHFAFTWGGLDPSRHVCLSVLARVSVWGFLPPSAFPYPTYPYAYPPYPPTHEILQLLLIELSLSSRDAVCCCRYLFWTDCGMTPKIERAELDGSSESRREIVNTHVQCPVGLTIGVLTFFLELCL